MQYNPYAPNPQLQMERVASIEEAKRFRVFPGQTVYLLDQEQPMIYMKSANQEGGAIARETIATANTEYYTVTISAEILKTPCKALSSLTVMNLSSIALNVTNVAVRVKRDA